MPREVRKHLFVLSLLIATILMTVPPAETAAAGNPRDFVGAVYTMTNNPSGNAVIMFHRTAHGLLVPGGSFSTEGLGSGNGLGNQGALALSAGNTGPAQISFSPNGRFLAVTEKATNLIDTWRVGRDGLASDFVANSSEGATPFGFAFGKRDLLFVSEAAGGAPDGSSMSSYVLEENGTLQVVNSEVPTTETAACWVVATNDGRFAYTTNAGSGTVSGFRIAFDGTITLLDADGVTGNTGSGSGPIDMALSNDGRSLFTLNGGSHAIGAFKVHSDGSLSPLPGASGIPPGANGLAAR